MQSPSAEALLAAIVASSDDAIVSKDRHGNVTSWNPAAERMFGYSAEEMVGHHISVLFPEDLVGRDRDILAEILAGRKVDHYETRRVTKSGDIVQVSLTVSPLRDADGTIVGASKIVRDITEQRRSEALSRANEELATAARAKDHYLAMANHELRTPLTSIAGFASTLLHLDGQIDANARREMLTIIDSQSKRLTRLVDDLMSLTRAEIDRSGMCPRQIDVADAIAHALHDFDRHDLVVHVSEGLQVYADPQQFQQMLMNLVDNAGKYASSGIEVHAREANGSMRLEVWDDGPGIPDELKPRLFDRFSRAQRDVEAGTPGTGLGLAIVRSLARAHGGDAWLDERRQQGATFCVRLPLRPVEPTVGE